MGRNRKRRGARIQPQHPAFFETPCCSGSALLCEVSYSGARLEVSDAQPVLGDPARIYVWPANHPEPFELTGTVVGLRDNGFAVEYEEAGQEICQWIDALEAGQNIATPSAPERSGES